MNIRGGWKIKSEAPVSIKEGRANRTNISREGRYPTSIGINLLFHDFKWFYYEYFKKFKPSILYLGRGSTEIGNTGLTQMYHIRRQEERHDKEEYYSLKNREREVKAEKLYNKNPINAHIHLPSNNVSESNTEEKLVIHDWRKEQHIQEPTPYVFFGGLRFPLAAPSSFFFRLDRLLPPLGL